MLCYVCGQPVLRNDKYITWINNIGYVTHINDKEGLDSAMGTN